MLFACFIPQGALDPAVPAAAEDRSAGRGIHLPAKGQQEAVAQGSAV